MYAILKLLGGYSQIIGDTPPPPPPGFGTPAWHCAHMANTALVIALRS